MQWNKMPELSLTRLRRLAIKLGLQGDWYLVFVAAIIGMVMGAVAVAFILPLRWLEHRAAEMHPSTLLVLIPLAPIIGALLTGIVIRAFGKSVAGAGVSSVMYSIHRQKGRIPLRVAFSKWIASTLTIGSGGSAGAEGPIVTIGASIGSWLGRTLKTNPENTVTMLGCAAAAGISSVFNAPIAGIFFVLEILLRDFSFKTFTPIVIASVISAAWTQALLGQGDALFVLSSDFGVGAFTVLEIPNYLVLGVLCGIIAVIFIRMMQFSEDTFARLRAPSILKPALGAAALGLLGLAYLLASSSVSSAPAFYGNGYPVIGTLISPQTYYTDATLRTLLPMSSLFTWLVALTILKIIATCLTIGSGGSGGLFAPSLLIGASTGGALGYVINWVGLAPSASPAHYAVVGMAAMIAAGSHAPLTGILLVYEITQRYEIILPLMFTAVIASFIGRVLHPDSLYTGKLARLGVRVGGRSDLMVLRRLSVHDVPLAEAVTVRPDDRAMRLLELSEQHAVTDFVVVDQNNYYRGMVTAALLRDALVYREALPLLQVEEVERRDIPTVTFDETLDVVMDKFSRLDVQSMAVIESAAVPRVLGLITRSRLMRTYQNAVQED